MDDEQWLEQQFTQMGHPFNAAFPAWSGLYPYWDGNSNNGYLFTLRRAIALTGESLEVWTAWSGPPSKLLESVGRDRVHFRREGRSYDRLTVGDRTFWTPANKRSAIREWLSDPDREQ